MELIKLWKLVRIILLLILNAKIEKPMKKLGSVLWFTMACMILAYGQESIQHEIYFPKTVIFKLKSDLKINTSELSNLKVFKMLFQNQETFQIKRLYPNHQTPRISKDLYGNALVDLSLIYELTYTSNEMEKEVIGAMQKTPYFEYVQPRYRHYPLYQPNDPALPDSQWHHQKIASFEAWDLEQGDTTIIIGISDCGTDFYCPDLVSNIAYNYKDTIDGIDNDNDGYIDNFYGWNMADNNNNPQYGNMVHGNFVAGMCSATGNNGFGGAGVALKCKYLPIKVETNNQLINTYESIVYAADHRCSVVNCSWGSASGKDWYGQDIVNYATFNQNCLVISAAGNKNNDIPYYPAALDNVISVASTDTIDEKGSNASYHYSVDICAPGMSVYSTLYGNVNSYSSGSSFAAPLVAGAAALLKSDYPEMTALQLGEQLKVSSDIVAATQNFPCQMGYGRLNVYQALTMMSKPSIIAKNIKSSQIATNMIYGITADFQNMLADADTITIKISCNRDEVIWIDSVLTITNFESMRIVSSTQDFKYQLSLNFPADSILIFKFQYTGKQYTGYQCFEYIPKSKNLNILANKISTTMTSTGNFGYDQNSPRQGLGVIYNSKNYLSLGGIVFSKTAFAATDNIYNENLLLDNDFKCDTLPHIVLDNDTLLIAEAYYTDQTDASQNLEITLRHRIYAFKTELLEKTLIQEYVIYNQGNTEITDLYGGIYNDWDLLNALYNKIDWNESGHFSYVYPATGGTEVAVSYLSNCPNKVYAFDNDGTNQSINLYDGFFNYMKYNALTTNRYRSGQTDNGTDVSLMNSYGPLNILVGDTLTIAFGIIFGENPLEIKQTNTLLQKYYNQIIAIDKKPTLVNENNMFKETVYPNPASDELYVRNDESTLKTLKIIDMSGRLVMERKALETGLIKLDIAALKAGFYIMTITSEQGEKQYKICIQ